MTQQEKKRRCYECGTGQILLTQKFDRYMRYKTLQRVEIPPSIAIPTCNNCGTEWLDDGSVKAIDEAAEKIYRDELR